MKSEKIPSIFVTLNLINLSIILYFAISSFNILANKIPNKSQKNVKNFKDFLKLKA